MLLLKDIPEQFKDTYKELITNPHVQFKMERNRRIDEKLRYVTKYLPEVMSGGLSVLDLGTGPGEFLEVVRSFNCKGIGINPPENHRWLNLSDSVLSKYHEDRILKYNEFSKINISRQLLEVKTFDVFNCIMNENKELENMKFNIINCQDAINLILIKHYEVHSEIDNYKNKRIFGNWIINDDFYNCLNKMIDFFDKLLMPNGSILISALASTNDKKYSRTIINSAENFGYKVELCINNNIHKFRKNNP
jgi:hypothetical protein